MITDNYGHLSIWDWQLFDSCFLPNGAYGTSDVSITFFNPNYLDIRETQTGLLQKVLRIVFFTDSVGKKAYVFYGDYQYFTVTITNSFSEINNYFSQPLQLPINWYGKIDFRRDEEITSLINYRMYDPNANNLFLYLLNSDKHTVSKTLIAVDGCSGDYTKPVTMKHLFVDLKNYGNIGSFNYVFIPKLKRYYYVKEITLLKDIKSVELIEDVLMSFADLIRLQSAFVSRNENVYNDDLIDSYVSFDYEKQHTYTSITLLKDIFASTNVTSTCGGYYVLTTLGG